MPNYSHQQKFLNDDQQPFTYSAIQGMRKNNKFVNPTILFRGIVEEAKNRRNFPNAEALFKELEGYMKEKEKIRRDYVHDSRDVHAFQRSITTIIRYVPTPEQALKYTTYFFEFIKRPIRDAATELIVFTNVIFAHVTYGTHEAMEGALFILELALSLGVYNIDKKLYNTSHPNNNGSTFRDSLSVFETVSKKVLIYFKLKYSEDRMRLVPGTTDSTCTRPLRQFSH
ncbi:uncharacterized protein BX663DRAFT_503840 [Cokeromyces recurvatus]|uniref:uncharacterized protein n=1 Tax=Cokeromyces recurvatus TaxID=90255 RepID=UPI00221EE480|nr:uncharacterized protein BX663DRAFT_503840 [Cokeromyces recurvatus]KAI7904867.1 hypothetical protein BX663DRAFT_503840 [Cokeromyces recurvatus]